MNTTLQCFWVMASIVLDEKTGPIWISRPCLLFGFWTMSLARLVLLGLCRSLSLLLGLRLLVGEHLLLDEHAVGLRGVLLLGHVHAFLMAQLVGVREHAGLDLLGETHELVLFEDAHGDGVRPAGWIMEGQGGAHHVREVRDGDEQTYDGDQYVGVKHAEADEQEDQTPDEAAEVESRVRVDAGDIAQRDGLGGRAERDQPEQGVRRLVLHARAGCGDGGFEPEDDHARTETVSDDVLLAGRVSEFGHGLCGFGHVLLLFAFYCVFLALSFSRMGVGERERSGWFRRANLLADDGGGSEFLEVPPAHVSFRPGPEFSEFPAIGCLTSVSACFVCSHDSSPGLSGPFAAASWSMAGSGSGTFDWMLGNSRSSRFGTGVSSESTPSR